jgi:flagellar hook-associated protein 3 FlgL
MFRVTLMSMHRNVLSDTMGNLATVSKYQEQLSSGKRIQVMSDDPISGRRALIGRTEGAQVDKYLDNIAKSLTFMESTDSTMGEMISVFDQAKEIAVQGANGTQDASSRASLARSVDSLLDRLVDLSNAVHDGRYIFAGTSSLTKPFELDATRSDVQYHGDLDDFEVGINFNGTRSVVNQNGYDLWKASTDVFAVLVDLREALDANDPQAVGELIDGIDVANDHINTLQGELGGRAQRLELTRSQLEEASLHIAELVSREEDVDMAETIMKLQNAQVALEASLQAGARVLQPSLLDFI